MTPTLPIKPALIDDRILIGELVGEKLLAGRRRKLFTTSYFYFRACRAFVLGGSGKLSGPFQRLDAEQRYAAMGRMLRLPESIGLPDSRGLVPLMVEVQGRHPRLNVLNTEAAAAALLLDAELLLTRPTANGQLAEVLDSERINWQFAELPGSG